MADIRFGQLKPGQCFIWQGTEWQKTSPLLARAQDSEEPRMIARSTIVTLTDEQPAANDAIDHTRKILQELQQECLQQMELLQFTPDQIQTIKKILVQATGNAARKLGSSS